MTISTNLEQLGYSGPSGCVAPGLHRQVISEGVATRQLLPGESGSLCLFDRAAGTVYTLPAPVQGMQFEFLTTVSVTSNAQKVITKTIASEFIVGSVTEVTIATATPAGFSADGTSIVSLSSNGTTTGGLIGSRFTVTAISASQWAIAGVIVGSGTIVTPFATS